MEADVSLLDRENRVVLALIQALVGAVSENVRRVSVGQCEDVVQVQFVLHHDSDDDLDEISDIEFEFEVLLDSSTDVAVEVVVSAEPLAGIPPAGRVVFARRERR